MNANLDFSEILKGIPESLEKVFRTLIGAVCDLDEKVQKLSSEVKQSKRPGESAEFSSVAINSLIKNTEKHLINKLSIQESKLILKLEFFENEIKDLKAQTAKDLNSLNSKIDTKLVQPNIDHKLSSLKNEVKQEIQDSLISPLEFELKENYKSFQMLEQTMKVQTWNIEATTKEFNSRFDVHREKICKVETSVQEFMGKADEKILSIINPIKKEVELCEITIKNLYIDFERDLEEVMADLRSKDEDRQRQYKEHIAAVSKFCTDTTDTVKGLKKSISDHLQEIEILTGQMKSQIELFKDETLIAQKDLYHKAKSELVQGYRKEIFEIEEKLKWLPSQTQNISDMTPAEARLYTIETRIRTEEANRIKQVNRILKGNG